MHEDNNYIIILNNIKSNQWINFIAIHGTTGETQTQSIHVMPKAYSCYLEGYLNQGLSARACKYACICEKCSWILYMYSNCHIQCSLLETMMLTKNIANCVENKFIQS